MTVLAKAAAVEVTAREANSWEVFRRAVRLPLASAPVEGVLEASDGIASTMNRFGRGASHCCSSG
jgi:hypothetical protein